MHYLEESVDVSSLVQNFQDNLFGGSELLIAGKTVDKKTREIGASVSGRSSEGNVAYEAHSEEAAYPCFPNTWLQKVPESVHTVIVCSSPEQTTVTRGPKSLGGFVERMWAYLTIKRLLEKTKLEPDDSENSRLKQKALQLSLKVRQALANLDCFFHLLCQLPFSTTL